MTRRDRRRAARARDVFLAAAATVSWAAALFSLSQGAPARAQRLPSYVPPPYLHSITPDKGHVVGGTTVTITGGGFQRNSALSVRFAYYDPSTPSVAPEVDIVKATYVDFSSITVVTPPRKKAANVHVTVANNGIGYSTTPLNTDDDGTFLYFTYKDSDPSGDWVIRNATGHTYGGTVVEISNPSHNYNNRMTDDNFLPGVHLRCRFGNPSDQSSVVAFTVSAGTKTNAHPWFGRGADDGFSITSSRVNGQGAAFILQRDTAYTFTASSLGDHAFYLSTVEPAMWSSSRLSGNALTSPISTGSVTFTPDANTPDFIFYHSTSDAFMGGMITVIDSTDTTTFQTAAAEANTVKAEWVSYSLIRCVAPAWVSGQDDDTTHGGKQVTIFVSNDGVTYHSGQGGADSATPVDAGDGSTFTYFDNSAFEDVPIYYEASGTTYIDGVPLKLNLTANTVSTIYGDSGAKDAVAAASYAAAKTAYDEEAAKNTEGSDVANDLIVDGAYGGDGLGWYEVVIDDASNDAETFRWRFHSSVGSDVAWVETGRAIPVGLAGGSVTDPAGNDASGALGNDLSIRFTSSGSHHQLGDRWLIRVYGGKPNVVSARTTHEETTYPARGPFSGNTEISVHGSGFFPSSNMLCKLHDSDTSVTHTLQASFDNLGRVRCITKKHAPRSGGEIIGTFRPCFEKTIQVSVDGGTTWSTVKSGSDQVKFFFCDIYVAKDGSDTYGDGTPNQPYLTFQRAIEAALGEPRAYGLSYSVSDSERGTRTPPQYRSMKFGGSSKIPENHGFSFMVNRDKFRVKSGTYTGAGNVGLHPLGKMLEAESKDGQVVIDCGSQAYTAMLVNGDRHGTEEVTNSGSLSFYGINHVNCG